MIKSKAQIQKERLEFAEMCILEIGLDITFKGESWFEFYYKDELIRFFPFTGWATGKSIKDGRGLNKLINQLK